MYFDRTYIVPCTVIVFVFALEFHSLVCDIEGVYKLPMVQEEGHEVVLFFVRYIKDEAKGRMCLYG